MLVFCMKEPNRRLMQPRDANLFERLTEKGFLVEGSRQVPTSHDIISDQYEIDQRPINLDESDFLFNQDSFSNILAGDCSIEVGTFTAFRKAYGENSNLLVLVGHVD
jgi:arginase